MLGTFLTAKKSHRRKKNRFSKESRAFGTVTRMYHCMRPQKSTQFAELPLSHSTYFDPGFPREYSAPRRRGQSLGWPSPWGSGGSPWPLTSRAARARRVRSRCCSRSRGFLRSRSTGCSWPRSADWRSFCGSDLLGPRSRPAGGPCTSPCGRSWKKKRNENVNGDSFIVWKSEIFEGGESRRILRPLKSLKHIKCQWGAWLARRGTIMIELQLWSN